MLKIGLTGGIGSGKSTVSNRFAEHGTPIIDADEIAHTLLESSPATTAELIDTFGDRVAQSDGKVDRTYLRELVFADTTKRRSLEAILHPKIRNQMIQLADELSAIYCILSIPLLIEASQSDLVDRILVVEAPEYRRIEWIKNRSHLMESEIHNIFSAQTSDAVRSAAADDLIYNNKDLAHLYQQVDRLHKFYIQLAKQQLKQ